MHNINMSTSFHDDSSDDGMSITSSTFSEDTLGTGRGKRKAFKHPETKYYLAAPAPTMTQKQRLIHLRPRMVLQLQRLPPSGRPVPILEVKSSSTFVPRIAKKFPGLYKGSGQLGINDVMICKSENYDEGDTYDGDEVKETTCGTESYDEKEVIAVVCQAPKDSGYSDELCFDDGSRWTMAPGSKGWSFELTKTDVVTGEKIVARWVPAGTSRRSSFQTPITKAAKGAAEAAKMAKNEKYNFSLVDPLKRRHPVLATLKQTGLTIKDTYSSITETLTSSSASLSAEAPRPGSSADYENGAIGGAGTCPVPFEPPVIRTTEEQKLLIEISAVWLASRLGWCAWSDAIHPVPATTPPSGSKSSGRQRSCTLTPNGSAKHKRQRSGTVGSIAENVVDENNGVGAKGSLSKRSGYIFKRTSLNNGVFHSDSDHSPPRSTPQRSVSTGAAFMQKQAEKRASRPPSEAGSRPGSTTVSRNNSRPSSPRRACSVDMLAGLGMGILHGEALTKELQNYQGGRNSLPNSPGMRRTQSDFATLDGSKSVEESPHLRISETVVPVVTPNLLLGEDGESGKVKRRKSAMVPKRVNTVPSKESKPISPTRDLRGEPKKVSKMKVFIALFSKSQRRKNEEAEKGFYH